MGLILKANIRENVGKNLNALRKSGILPAIIYGYGIERAMPLQLNYNEFEKVYRKAGESSFINIEADGKKYDALIHDVGIDPVTDKFIHVDFYKVQMDKEIEVAVPLKFIGEAEAVKALGGTLVKSLHELTIEVLPKNLPHEITVDISSLKTFENTIRVRDLILPVSIKILAHNEDDVIVSVSAPASEEELAALETAPTAIDVEAVKVETQERKEKRGVEKEENKQ